MKRAKQLLVILAICLLAGCGSHAGSAGLGAVGGAAAGAGGYEYVTRHPVWHRFSFDLAPSAVLGFAPDGRSESFE